MLSLSVEFDVIFMCWWVGYDDESLF